MDSHLKPDFISLISIISEVLRKAELPFMLIGGQAVLLHGQPRLTERQAIDRAVEVTLNDVPVPFASPEDLILHKLFSGRPRDIEDIQGVVLMKGNELDWDYIEKWAAEFTSIPDRENLLDQVEEIKIGSQGS